MQAFISNNVYKLVRRATNQPIYIGQKNSRDNSTYDLGMAIFDEMKGWVTPLQPGMQNLRKAYPISDGVYAHIDYSGEDVRVYFTDVIKDEKTIIENSTDPLDETYNDKRYYFYFNNELWMLHIGESEHFDSDGTYSVFLLYRFNAREKKWIFIRSWSRAGVGDNEVVKMGNFLYVIRYNEPLKPRRSKPLT